MEKIIVDLCSKHSMLNKLFGSLDGVIPDMTKLEQIEYDKYGQELLRGNEDIFNYIKKM